MVATIDDVKKGRAARKINPRKPGMPRTELDYINAWPIVPRAWSKLRLVLVGCGGTGSWTALSIAQIAAVLKEAGRTVEVTFIDPDTVEQKNIPRQNFCRAELGRSKAATLAVRYGAAWGVDTRVIKKQFTSSHLGWPHDGELTVVVGAVDNAAARRSIATEVARANSGSGYGDRAPGVWWLDCGNSRDGGQVLLGAAGHIEDLRAANSSGSFWKSLPSPALQRPELLEALPEEASDASERMSCAELAMANQQSLMINRVIASLASDYLNLLVTGGLRKFATYVDMPSGAWKSYYTTPECVAASVGRSVAIFDSK